MPATRLRGDHLQSQRSRSTFLTRLKSRDGLRGAAPGDSCRFRKQDSGCLPVGWGWWEQVLDLIERKAPIFQLGRAAFGNRVPGACVVSQCGKLSILVSDACELGTASHDVVVPQRFAFAAVSARGEKNHLAVRHGLRLSQTIDLSVFELRSQDVTAFPDPFRRKHEDQNAPGTQSAVGMR